MNASTEPQEVGRRRRRYEDPRLLCGAGRYVEDISFPSMLHLSFVRSPYAHARIQKVDTLAARNSPGVVAVLTARDLPDRPPAKSSGEMIAVPSPLLATDVVRYVGEPIVVVAATSRALADDAASLVEVDYAPLPVVVDVDAALDSDAPLVHSDLKTNVAYHFRRGNDTTAAFATADHVVSLDLDIPRMAAVPLEARGVVAAPDAVSGDLIVWVTTQAPWRVKSTVAQFIGRPEQQIRVIAPDVGGGFGPRGMVHAEYVIAALLSDRLQRPVRWTATRREDFSTTPCGRAMRISAEMAASADGQIIGIRAHVRANVGAYATSTAQVNKVAQMLAGAYRVPSVSVEVIGAYTNTAPIWSFRGAGRPEAAYVVERLVDALARKVKVNPIDLRRRNFIRPTDFPYQTPLGAVYDSGNYARALDLALQKIDLKAFQREQAMHRAVENGPLLGMGLATYVEPSGGGWESGHVRVEPSGAVIASCGSSPQGQGHQTSFAQIVADRLQVAIDSIVVRQNDTALTPPGVGTFGSRSTILGGSALAKASDEVREQALRVAAALLEAAPEDIRLSQGRFTVAGTPGAARAVSWKDVARAAYAHLPAGMSKGLDATIYFEQETESYAFGACLALVRIDPSTGVVGLDRLILVHDCGQMVNPVIVEGQLHGGLAQGIAEALWEEVRYDENGQILTGSLLDYKLPRAIDLPSFELDHTITPSPLNPLGVKGVGEAGTIAAPPAVVNAVQDALSHLPIDNLDMPLTSEKIWRLIDGVRSKTR